jgi:SAM-dependent methyltransferase
MLTGLSSRPNSDALYRAASDESFDESGYLRANPDVAAAVKRGEWESGRVHHRVLGKSEGRPLGNTISSRCDSGYIELFIHRPWLTGFLDCVQVDRSGIIRLIGWLKDDFVTREMPSIRIDGHPIPFLQHFRFTRTDVPPSLSGMFSQTGLALDYLVPDFSIHRASMLSIDVSGSATIEFNADFHFVTPHYPALLRTQQVQHREDIYRSGGPNISVDPEVFELAKCLQGPVLDFGCGRGVLVAALQRLGVQAYGLELDTPIIRESLTTQNAEVTGSITLYDGSFPSPFEDGQFRSVMCSEVLEHISSYQSAIQEIARISTGKVIFTVPDTCAIPVGFRHGAVPWHLLEATHVNFFTQPSLKKALEPYFSKIEFGRVGAARFNESVYYVSLVAVCLK